MFALYRNGHTHSVPHNGRNIQCEVLRVKEGDIAHYKSLGYTDDISELDPDAVEVKPAPVAPVAPVAPDASHFDREHLLKVSEEKGMAGLREIGALYGVKSTSVEGLINGLVEHGQKLTGGADENQGSAG